MDLKKKKKKSDMVPGLGLAANVCVQILYIYQGKVLCMVCLPKL